MLAAQYPFLEQLYRLLISCILTTNQGIAENWESGNCINSGSIIFCMASGNCVTTGTLVYCISKMEIVRILKRAR